MMEKKMETTMVRWGYIGIIGTNYQNILGSYRDSGTENGNHYNIFGLGSAQIFLSPCMHEPQARVLKG